MVVRTQATAAPSHKKIYQHLYVQVLCAIAIGVLLGHFYPSLGGQMKPLGDMFIQAIKMVIAPIIFCTVVHGIASMEDMKKVGRVGLKAIVYFEVVTTLALVVGLIVANLWQPGAGMNVDPSTIDAKSVQQYAAKAHEQSAIDYVTHIIPSAVVGAFAEGEILQVLFFSLLFAFALSFLGERGKPLLRIIDLVSHTFFGVVAIIMRAAPIGAFGAMACPIGRYGVGTLLSLGHLMASVYATCLIFIFIVLGGIARLCGFSILKFIRYIKEELLIVLGTSSSESVLPRMIAKLENLGCQESVVGLVIPTGYSFNLDGTCIYLTMATLFLAQATNTELIARHGRLRLAGDNGGVRRRDNGGDRAVGALFAPAPAAGPDGRLGGPSAPPSSGPPVAAKSGSGAALRGVVPVLRSDGDARGPSRSVLQRSRHTGGTGSCNALGAAGLRLCQPNVLGVVDRPDRWARRGVRWIGLSGAGDRGIHDDARRGGVIRRLRRLRPRLQRHHSGLCRRDPRALPVIRGVMARADLIVHRHVRHGVRRLVRRCAL